MANYRAIANGNWNTASTWAGNAVPPNGEGHNIYSNNFTVTIDTNVNVALITNAAITASFVGGGTSAAAGGGFTVSASGLSVIASITGVVNATNALAFTALNPSTLTITGNITANAASGSATSGHAIFNASTGVITINTATITTGVFNSQSRAVHNSTAGQIILNTCTINGGMRSLEAAVSNTGGGVVSANNCVMTALSVHNTGTIEAINCVFNATTVAEAVLSTGTTRVSGTFLNATNGRQAINSAVWILGTLPSSAYIQHARDGINASSFSRFYTADNALGQANPTDVRSGVSYASGNLTGRLTVPARGSVALSVNYGPSMPFTATRSGTTATATLSYSYPLVVGDTITVTGASNNEWNSTYTIASVVSGTEVTFTVPETHSATAGAGANMQTTGTAVLDPAAVASAVWGAATRTLTSASGPTAADNASAVWQAATRTLTAGAGITAADVWSHASRTVTGGTVDTLTNAPTVPTAAAIATQVWEVADKTGYSLTSAERTAIAAAVEASILAEGDGQAILNAIVTAIGNSNVDQVALVAAIRTDMERNGGNLAAIKAKTDALPASPAATGDIPSANIAAIKAKTDNLPASPAATGDIPSANIAAIKSKTDLLNTDRLAQVSTVSTTGAQLAAALS